MKFANTEAEEKVLREHKKNTTLRHYWFAIKTIFSQIYSMKKLTTIIFATIAMLVGYTQVLVAG